MQILLVKKIIAHEMNRVSFSPKLIHVLNQKISGKLIF